MQASSWVWWTRTYLVEKACPCGTMYSEAVILVAGLIVYHRRLRSLSQRPPRPLVRTTSTGHALPH